MGGHSGASGAPSPMRTPPPTPFGEVELTAIAARIEKELHCRLDEMWLAAGIAGDSKFRIVGRARAHSQYDVSRDGVLVRISVLTRVVLRDGSDRAAGHHSYSRHLDGLTPHTSVVFDFLVNDSVHALSSAIISDLPEFARIAEEAERSHAPTMVSFSTFDPAKVYGHKFLGPIHGIPSAAERAEYAAHVEEKEAHVRKMIEMETMKVSPPKMYLDESAKIPESFFKKLYGKADKKA